MWGLSVAVVRAALFFSSNTLHFFFSSSVFMDPICLFLMSFNQSVFYLRQGRTLLIQIFKKKIYIIRFVTKTACVMKPLSIVTSSGFYQSLHPLQLGMSWGFTVTDLCIAVCVGLPDMRNSRRDSNRKSGRSRAEEEERLSDRERVQTVANSRSPAGHAGLRSFPDLYHEPF